MAPEYFFYAWCAFLFILMLMMPIGAFMDKGQDDSADEFDDAFDDQSYGAADQEPMGEAMEPMGEALEPVVEEPVAAADDFGAAEFEAFE